MERDFNNHFEVMQQFKAEMAAARDNCDAKLNRIQLDANIKKNQARAELSEQLIIIAKKQDDYLNEYREWKRQNKGAEELQ